MSTVTRTLWFGGYGVGGSNTAGSVIVPGGSTAISIVNGTDLSNLVHSSALLFLTNASMTLASNAISLSVNTGAAGNLTVFAGTNNRSSGSVSFANSNGVTFGMNTAGQVTGSVNTVYAGTNGAITGGSITVNTSGVSINLPAYLTTAQPPGAYLTTAMVSNAGSNFVAATATIAGTNITGTIASNGISLSVAAPGGSKAGTGFTSTTTAGTEVKGTLGTNGLSLAVPAYLTTAQPPGAYLTTAMPSNAGSNFVQATAAFAGTNASGTIASSGISVSVAAPGISGISFSDGAAGAVLTNLQFVNANGVSWNLSTAAQQIRASVKTDYAGTNGAITGGSLTVNTSGVSINLPAYLTTAMVSNAGSNFVAATAAFAGTNASGTIASSGISVSVAAQSADPNKAGTGFTSTTTTGTAVVATLNTNGLSMGVPSYLTTARASTDAIGLNTAATNVTWTVNSNGISLNAEGYAGTGVSATNATVTLNSNGIAISVAPGGTNSGIPESLAIAYAVAL